MNTTLLPVISRATTDFLTGLAQNAATPLNNIPGLPSRGAQRYTIRAISVSTKENFGPQFNFFNSASGYTTGVASDGFLGVWGFTSAMGAQLAATGLWRYYIDGLEIPYQDNDANALDVKPTVHVVLENISATAKSATANGAVEATFWLEPQQ